MGEDVDGEGGGSLWQGGDPTSCGDLVVATGAMVGFESNGILFVISVFFYAGIRRSGM